jgi:hypothetical protein
VIFDLKATSQQSFHDMSLEELRANFRTPAALESCGFTYKEACIVLNRYYSAWDSSLHGRDDLQSERGTLNSFTRGTVRGVMAHQFASASDRERMGWVGFRQEVIDAIMDPEFEQIRNQQSLQYWVTNTINANWDMLRPQP